MRRITLTLTEQEYADLEARALAERRSIREMAGFLVTRPQPNVIVMQQLVPIGPAPINPIWPPNVWCGTVDSTGTNGYTPWNERSMSAAFATGIESAIEDVRAGRVMSFDAFKQAIGT